MSATAHRSGTSSWSSSTRCGATPSAATARRRRGDASRRPTSMPSPGSRCASRGPIPRRCRRCARGAPSTRACARIPSTTATSATSRATSSASRRAGGRSPKSSTRWRKSYGSAGFRTGLISDLYHEFKPSKNFWRGFHQWTFIRGQEADAARSGPYPTQAEIDYWVPRELQELRGKADRSRAARLRRALVLEPHPAQHARPRARGAVVQRPGDAGVGALGRAEPRRRALFLTVESFDPHEPWFVPEHYRKRYDAGDGREQVISPYAEMPGCRPELVKRTRANYAGLVEMCDRWFGHLIETLRVTGRARRGAGGRHLRPWPQPLGAARVHRQARLSLGSGELRGAAAGAASAQGSAPEPPATPWSSTTTSPRPSSSRRRAARRSRSTASRSCRRLSPAARRFATT